MRPATYAPSGYALVWREEFQGDRVDKRVWSPWTNDAFADRAKWENVTDLDDPRCFGVRDSILTVTCPAPVDGSPTPVPAALCTRESMMWAHGYAEARLRFPRTDHRAWGSWWMNTRQYETAYTGPWYTVETDIFENYGWQQGWRTLNNQVSTSHKWHVDGLGSEASTLVGSPRWVDGLWHILGLWWARDRMEILVDGARCGYLDLVRGYGRHGMSGFHDPAWMLLGLWPRTDGTTTETIFMQADWIRVWQDPDDPGQRLYVA